MDPLGDDLSSKTPRWFASLSAAVVSNSCRDGDGGGSCSGYNCDSIW